MQNTFFCKILGRFLKKLGDDQCSSITKGTKTYICLYHFARGKDWLEIGHKWKYLLWLIFTHIAFLLYMAEQFVCWSEDNMNNFIIMPRFWSQQDCPYRLLLEKGTKWKYMPYILYLVNCKTSHIKTIFFI